MTHSGDGSATSLTPGMNHKDIVRKVPKFFNQIRTRIQKDLKDTVKWGVTQHRCFLGLQLLPTTRKDVRISGPGLGPTGAFETHIQEIIHLPGLRGNPERVYPVTAVGPRYPGTFQEYVASIITDWQVKKNQQKLAALTKDLEYLGLTWKIRAEQIDDTRVKLRVGRLPHAAKGGAHDLVDIADIGFGLSQSLPVVVALHAAKRGQVVYLEQPEIHLHPHAQYKLATVLANAINRGVRIIVETHSALLLLAIQTLVAQTKLETSKLKLHWFERNEEGETKITCANLDDAGAFGDWPEDFGRVELEAEKNYLDAAELKQKPQ